MQDTTAKVMLQREKTEEKPLVATSICRTPHRSVLVSQQHKPLKLPEISVQQNLPMNQKSQITGILQFAFIFIL